MPDYKTNDPRGWCGDPTRGAALGRATIREASPDFAGKLTLRRVCIDDGGYDQNGTYFGDGEPLWWCADEEGEIDFMLRATDREAAAAEVREHYPRAEVAHAPDVGERIGETEIDAFTVAYIKCALWLSNDESTPSGGVPLDENYSAEDLAPDTLAEIIADCAAFQRDNATDLSTIASSQAGHDFWLTRNGHGAGFWDRGLGELGERLSEAARKCGEVNLYVGDDEKIYC